MTVLAYHLQRIRCQWPQFSRFCLWT